MNMKRQVCLYLVILLVFVPGHSWANDVFMPQKQLDDMLIQAIKAHDTPATLKALEAGANPNALDTEDPIYTLLAPYWKICDIQALIQTYGRGHQTALLLALEGDLKTQVTDENLFAFFSNQVDPHLIQALLEYGANVNVKDKFGRTPLIAAFNPIPREIFTLRGNFTFPSNEKCAISLIEAGADVNTPDELGVTPLLYAHSHEVRQALLRHGANVNGGVFPVLIAYAMENNKEGCLLLLDHGADVNASENGWTALTYAAQNGHEAVVNTLIARGANVNANVGHGRTPLMAAASNGGHLSILQTLLARGAIINAVDEYGMSALDWASGEGNRQIIEILRKAGAKTSKELSAQSATPQKR